MGIQNNTVKRDIKVLKRTSTLSKTSSDFQEAHGRKPIAGVDLSGWIVAAIRSSTNQKVVEQFHSQPPQPVSASSEYVMKRVTIFQRCGWDLLLVLDGQRNPLKAETNEKRKGSLEEDRQKLAYALQNENSFTVRRVEKLMRKTMCARNDIYGEVIRCLKQNNVPVFGAPFETDHQMVALQRQGMIDFVVSKDTDMPFLGISTTIFNFNATNGNCDFLELYGPNGLMERFFQKKFECNQVAMTDVCLFACLVGNDFVEQLSQQFRYPDIVEIMKQWARLPEHNKDAFLGDSILKKYENAGTGVAQKFRHALYFWKHAPAYFIIPFNGESDNAQTAFKNGRYSVSLRSMDSNLSFADSPTFDTQVEAKMGFDPVTTLRQSHGHVSPGDEASHKDFVNLNKWSRAGLEFDQIAPQTNLTGAEVFPGSILDFKSVPMKFVSTKALEIYLRSRGISVASDADRDTIEVMVNRVLEYEIDALPKACFRGGGGYVTWAILSPIEGRNEGWIEGDDALQKLQSFANIFPPGPTPSSLEPLPSSNAFVMDTLSNMKNSRRRRCLRHLESGSFDLRSLNISIGLRSDACPSEELFVVKTECAPSQRIDTTSRHLYTVILVFEVLNNESMKLKGFPFSKCDCATGVGWCAHKGGMLLLLFLLRKCFRDKNFSETLRCLPCSIFSVAAQSVPVHFRYPQVGSSEAKIKVAIRNKALRDVGYAAFGSDSESDEDSDFELPESLGPDDPPSEDHHDENVSESSEDEDYNSEEEESDSDDDDDYDLDEDLDDNNVNETRIDLCHCMYEFAASIEASVDERNAAHHMSVERIARSARTSAQPETNQMDIARQNILLRRHHRAVKDGMMFPSMLSFYAADFVERTTEHAESIDKMTDFVVFEDGMTLTQYIKEYDNE